MQVVKHCYYAAKFLKDTVGGSTGRFEQQLRLVHCLQHLLTLGTAVSAGSEHDTTRLTKLQGTFLVFTEEGLQYIPGAGGEGFMILYRTSILPLYIGRKL